jgi:hypothetical protein
VSEPTTPAPPAPPPSGPAVVGGIGGAGALVYLLDALLRDEGGAATNTLARLGPVLGPAWASWPLIALGGVLAWYAARRFHAGELRRAAEAAAAVAATEQLARGVADVGRGVDSLRGEVHSLRADLRGHVETTDQRFRAADSSMRDFVRGEISPVADRVAALERRRPQRAARRGTVRE